MPWRISGGAKPPATDPPPGAAPPDLLAPLDCPVPSQSLPATFVCVDMLWHRTDNESGWLQ